MFQKSIEAIIAQGVKELEDRANQIRKEGDEARIKISQIQSEIQSLANLAKQVPEKVFDRYSNVLVATFDIDGRYQNEFGMAHIDLGQCRYQLRGLMGDEKFKAGKYRAIVLLEPIS